MIILHCKDGDSESESLKQSLDDMILAYKTVYHNENDVNITLPFIEEDGNIYSTTDEIEQWLRQLQDELDWQRSLSGDGCYIDPKTGDIC